MPQAECRLSVLTVSSEYCVWRLYLYYKIGGHVNYSSCEVDVETDVLDTKLHVVQRHGTERDSCKNTQNR